MAAQVTLFVRAKSLIVGELKRAGKQIKAFADGAAHIFKAAAKAVLAFGAVLAGLAVKAISAYAVQEKAVKALASAHRMFGDDVEASVKAETELAAKMQDETGVADELTIQRMANLKMLGLQTSALGTAAKAVIALTHAGMGEDQAMRAVADAANGNFEAFRKVIPALKNVTDESEKARIVNDYLAKQYQGQKDDLDTVSGRWGALKGRVGDAWEEVGKAISQNEALAGVLHKAGEKVKELTQRFADWAASGGVVNLIATVKMFGENFRNTFAKIGIYAAGFFKGGLWNPAKAAFQYVGAVIGTFVNLAVVRFTYLKDMAVAIWEKIKNPMKKFDPPNTNEVKAAYNELFKSLKGEYADKIPNAFVEMNKKLTAEQIKHNKTIGDLSKQQLENLENINKKRVESTVETLEEIKIAEVNHADEIKKLQDGLKKDNEDMAKLREKQADEAGDAEIKALQERIDKTQKLIAKNAELAAQSVQDIIARKAAEKAAAKEAAKEFEKGARLAAKSVRLGGQIGGRMTKKDAEFLAAWQEKNKANVAAKLGQFFGDIDKLELADLQKVKDSKNLETTAKEIVILNGKISAAQKSLNTLLAATK